MKPIAIVRLLALPFALLFELGLFLYALFLVKVKRDDDRASKIIETAGNLPHWRWYFGLEE